MTPPRALAALLPAGRSGRLLAASNLVNTVGSGLYLPSSALFFTRYAGLGVTQVGVGLSVAGLVGLAGSVPIGLLADRHGPRRTYATVLSAQAALMASFSLVRSLPMLVLLASGYLLADGGAAAAKGALIASTGADPADRVRLRAYLRAVTNVGITVGAALAGVALQVNSPRAYLAFILGDAATFALAALPLRWLPPAAPPRTHLDGGRWPALRDRPYLAVTAVCGALSVHADLLSFAVPLWVVGHSFAPRVMVAGIVVINTVLVVLLQVRTSRGTEEPTWAARLHRRAGWTLLAACATIAFLPGLPRWPAVFVLVGYAVLHTVGELWQAAAGFGLSFGLAPDDSQGQYQGLFALGRGVTKALAPTALTLLCLRWGQPGWLVLGAFLAATGSVTPLLVGWARRRTGLVPA